MSTKIIDFDDYQEPWKKDKLMVAFFDALAEVKESKPFLNEMINKRALEILPKLKDASFRSFEQSKEQLLAAPDNHKFTEKLERLIHEEFRKLTSDEKDVLLCSIETNDDFNSEFWTWYEWDIASELMSQNQRYEITCSPLN